MDRNLESTVADMYPPPPSVSVDKPIEQSVLMIQTIWYGTVS